MVKKPLGDSILGVGLEFYLVIVVHVHETQKHIHNRGGLSERVNVQRIVQCHTLEINIYNRL